MNIKYYDTIFSLVGSRKYMYNTDVRLCFVTHVRLVMSTYITPSYHEIRLHLPYGHLNSKFKHPDHEFRHLKRELMGY